MKLAASIILCGSLILACLPAKAKPMTNYDRCVAAKSKSAQCRRIYKAQATYDAYRKKISDINSERPDPDTCYLNYSGQDYVECRRRGVR
jgi:hypothetical protein